MGCFDVVCALTNTPIHNRDKCHLVVLRRDADWNTLVWLQTSEGRLGVDRVFHGEYNDYGSIEECTPALTEKDEEYLEEMHDHENPRKSFFICDTAWQWCQDKFKDWTPWFVREREMQEAHFKEMFPDRENSLTKLYNPEREAGQIEVARVMQGFEQACKHPLAGLGQYRQYQREVIADLKEIAELSAKCLKVVEDRYAEWDAEDIEPEVTI
jgi:hypothetical protein